MKRKNLKTKLENTRNGNELFIICFNFIGKLLDDAEMKMVAKKIDQIQMTMKPFRIGRASEITILW